MLERKKYGNVYIICGFLGAITFLLFFGPGVLDPVNDDWLMGEGADLTQHYIGWLAYRRSSWMFPVGCMDNLAYPFHTSVIFTDSIPLFAVFFKLFSPVLPDTFQYFGIYGLICYILQSVLAAILLKKYIKGKLDIVLGSAFFLLSPVMLARMYYHTALASHFLILLTMSGIVYYEEVFHKTGNAAKLSALTAFLASSIHIYLLAMCGIVWLSYCMLDLLKTKKITGSIIVMSTFLTVSAGIVWLLGGMNGVFGAGRGGLGNYGLNMNAFFNSQGNSALVRGLKLPDVDASEGFAYLGTGIYLLALSALVFLIHNRQKFLKILKSNWEKTAAAVLSGILVYLFAILPSVYWNDKLLLKLELPDRIEKIWSIFRATGRFSWLIYYLCFLFIITISFQMKRQKRTVLSMILGISLIIQFYDMTPQISRKNTAVDEWAKERPVLADPCWEEIAESGNTKHVYFGFAEMDADIIYPVAEWAVTNGMTVNRFYFARSLDKEAVADMLGDAMWEKEMDCIFIFRPEDKDTCVKNGFSYVMTEDDLLLAGGNIE